MKPALLKNIRRQWNYNTFRQSLAVLNISILNNFVLDNYQNQSTCDKKISFFCIYLAYHMYEPISTQQIFQNK